MTQSAKLSSCLSEERSELPPCHGADKAATTTTTATAIPKMMNLDEIQPVIASQQQQQQRKHSISSDVEIVVTKAKKAAASLWMLLHAQSCRHGAHRCPQRGCHSTKLLLLHIKTCPAGRDFACPQKYRGCQEAKKLLAHYRRCRQIRAKQAYTKQSATKQQQQQQQASPHVCLICSLLARHARSMLQDDDRTTNTKMPTMLSRHSPSYNSHLTIQNISSSIPHSQQPIVTENSFNKPHQQQIHDLSSLLMPPPPPRTTPTTTSFLIPSQLPTNSMLAPIPTNNNSWVKKQPTPNTHQVFPLQTKKGVCTENYFMQQNNNNNNNNNKVMPGPLKGKREPNNNMQTTLEELHHVSTRRIAEDNNNTVNLDKTKKEHPSSSNNGNVMNDLDCSTRTHESQENHYKDGEIPLNVLSNDDSETVKIEASTQHHQNHHHRPDGGGGVGKQRSASYDVYSTLVLPGDCDTILEENIVDNGDTDEP